MTSKRINALGYVWGPLSRLGLGVAVAAFAVDQAHKWWMLLRVGMRENDKIVVTPFFDWFFVTNKGVSYSFLTSSSQSWQISLAIFSVIATLALAVWLARGVGDALTAASIGLIMGGALGNGLDRLTLGGVADFFYLHAPLRRWLEQLKLGWLADLITLAQGDSYWYVFNIADVAIVAGVIGLLYESVSGRGVNSLAPAATKAPQTDS